MDKTNIVNVNRVYEETLKKEATAYRLRCVPKSLPLTSMFPPPYHSFQLVRLTLPLRAAKTSHSTQRR